MAASVSLPAFPLEIAPSLDGRLSVGIDLAQVSVVAESLSAFGPRYLQRVYTAGERAYAGAADSGGTVAQRLAGRWAAKEAAVKALGWGAHAIDWREFEVARQDDGQCRLALHGVAAARAAAEGVRQTALSLSHDGDYACAIVAVVRAAEPASS